MDYNRDSTSGSSAGFQLIRKFRTPVLEHTTEILSARRRRRNRHVQKEMYTFEENGAAPSRCGGGHVACRARPAGKTASSRAAVKLFYNKPLLLPYERAGMPFRAEFQQFWSNSSEQVCPAGPTPKINMMAMRLLPASIGGTPDPAGPTPSAHPTAVNLPAKFWTPILRHKSESPHLQEPHVTAIPRGK